MKDNKFLQGVMGLLGLALIVFIGLKTRNAYQEYNYIGKAVRDRDVITIAGEGKVTARPDLVRIDLGVQTDAKTVSEAQRQNTQKMNSIIAALKALKIASEDIQTTGYSIYPKYQYTDGRSFIEGYTVSQNVTVKVRNLDSVGDVLAKAGELGANQVGGIQFTIDEPKALEEQAREKAIDDARQKAQTLAEQLGLTIIKVVSFTESSGSTPPPYPMYAKAMDLGAAEAAPSPTIESGSLEVVSNVNVVFEVR
jgi:uncharacterized protein